MIPVSRPRLQTACGIPIVLIAAAMWIQHLTNTRLGVDLSAMHTWLSDPNPTPGRMAPNTALAFLLAGTAIVLMPHAAGRAAWRVIEILAFAIIFMGLTGAVGYALKLEFLYGWYQYTRMALPTAAGMIVLGFDLWSAGRQFTAAGRCYAPAFAIRTCSLGSGAMNSWC